MKYWERKENLFRYTRGAREYFPLASEQLEVIARLVDKLHPGIRTFLDLGCGDGFLGHFIYRLYPECRGMFLDISEEMIRKARKFDSDHHSDFIIQDFADPLWYRSIRSPGQFDLIISGYAIHHIEDPAKRRLFKKIYDLLAPGGLFLNLEHVSSPSMLLEEAFDELFMDGMSEYQKQIGEEKDKEQLRELYNDPAHQKLNRLAPVEVQCNWLRTIGFSNVDCYMKIFELALFGGTKPGV